MNHMTMKGDSGSTVESSPQKMQTARSDNGTSNSTAPPTPTPTPTPTLGRNLHVERSPSSASPFRSPIMCTGATGAHPYTNAHKRASRKRACRPTKASAANPPKMVQRTIAGGSPLPPPPAVGTGHLHFLRHDAGATVPGGTVAHES